MGDSQPRRLEERIAREVGLALALMACAIAQTTLLPRPLGFPPNLVLLLTICQAMLQGPARAARWAFYGGIALDLCAGSTLGSHALALLVAVLAAALPLMRLSRDNWLLPLGGALLGALGYYAALALVTLLVVGVFPIQSYVLIAALPDTLMTLIPALPLFLLWRWWNSRRRGEVPLDMY